MNSNETPVLGTDDPLDAALARLDQAVKGIESRFEDLQSGPGESGDDSALQAESARLHEALEQSRSREGELESAVSEASRALDDTLDELRTLLQQEGD